MSITRRSFFKRVTSAFAGLALCQQIVLAKFDTFKLEAPKLTTIENFNLPSQEAMFESWMTAKKLREQRGMLEAHSATHPWDHEAEKRHEVDMENRAKPMNQKKEAKDAVTRMEALDEWRKNTDPHKILRHVLKNSGKPVANWDID